MKEKGRMFIKFKDHRTADEQRAQLSLKWPGDCVQWADKEYYPSSTTVTSQTVHNATICAIKVSEAHLDRAEEWCSLIFQGVLKVRVQLPARAGARGMVFIRFASKEVAQDRAVKLFPSLPVHI